MLATVLLTATLPVQACRAISKLNPNAEAHYLEFTDKSVRFASNKLALNEDDLLFLRLPNNTSVETSNGDATLNYIRDIHLLETARFTEIAPLTLISGAKVALQNSKPGYMWMAFQAMRGNTTLTVDIDGVKTALNVSVKPYSPPAPEPIKVSMEKATQDKPFGMRAGQEFEFSLPGQLADGWAIDIPKNSGVTVKSLTPAKQANGTSTSSQPMVRLLFDVAGGAPYNIPQRISIRRGGVFNGETFDLYLVFYPIPTGC
ncbi:MAG: hypothetical protein ACM3PQ_00070 [Methanosarcina sp.]